VESRLAAFSTAIDELIRDLLIASPQYDGIYDMLRYHLGWIDESGNAVAAPPGKRLRPALCLLVAEGISGDWRAAVPGATAIELVHNFSLIHDDIEDRSELRRFRKTVWALRGEAQAINAGDSMLIVAEQALVERAPAERALPALRLLNRSCRGLCEGQYLDLFWEHETSVTEHQYLEMIERKTARLFQTAAEMGALFAGADEATQQQFGSFGSSLGMAFQVIDDLLGAWAPVVDTGKTAELDIATRKKTLPAVLGLSSDSPAGSRLRALYGLDRNLTPPETAEAIDLLNELGMRERTSEVARRYRDEAVGQLDTLAERHKVAPLRELILSVLPGIPQ